MPQKDWYRLKKTIKKMLFKLLLWGFFFFLPLYKPYLKKSSFQMHPFNTAFHGLISYVHISHLKVVCDRVFFFFSLSASALNEF